MDRKGGSGKMVHVTVKVSKMGKNQRHLQSESYNIKNKYNGKDELFVS